MYEYSTRKKVSPIGDDLLRLVKPPLGIPVVNPVRNNLETYSGLGSVLVESTIAVRLTASNSFWSSGKLIVYGISPIFISGLCPLDLDTLLKLPSATDFLTIAEESQQRTLLGWLEPVAQKAHAKTAMLVEKSSQAQRIEQCFAGHPASGNTQLVSQSAFGGCRRRS